MSKYHNSRMTVDGIAFDSLAEARRYQELKLLEAAGEIASLEVHPRYPLVVNGVEVGTYIADFRYYSLTERCAVIEDVKGVRTDVYRLKKRLMWALYSIEVVEVQA